MKRLLLLTLLSIPALARADSVSWSTYCDGNVEKVRCTITFYMPGAQWDEDWRGEMVAANYDGDCDLQGSTGCARFRDAVPTPLADGYVEFTWEGWLRSCLSADRPAFEGQIWFFVQEGNEPPRYYPRDFSCGEFEPTPLIVDNSTCTPLPVASTTWGAIKALYR